MKSLDFTEEKNILEFLKIIVDLMKKMSKLILFGKKGGTQPNLKKSQKKLLTTEIERHKICEHMFRGERSTGQSKCATVL